MLKKIFQFLNNVIMFFFTTGFWIYFLLTAFIWFFAKYTPERFVFIRIAASILSDIIWIPFGIVVWSRIIAFFPRIIFKLQGFDRFFLVTSAFIFSFVFNVIFTEPAFKYLFIPIFCTVILILYDIIKGKSRFSLFDSSIPVLCFSLMTVFYYGHQMYPHTNKEKIINPDFKVMTYNIRKDAGKENRMKTIATIKEQSPDILFCVEINPFKDPDLFKKSLGDRYKYIISSTDVKFQIKPSIILSKYPLKVKNVDLDSLKLGKIDFLFVDMDYKGKTINLVNFHLLTVGHHFETMHRNVGDIKEKISKANKHEYEIDAVKYSEVKTILDFISRFEGPVILCGDMNDTPNSRVFDLFSKNFKNAYSSTGWGLGDTFGESWISERRHLKHLPFINLFSRDVIRIDQIFVTKDFNIGYSGVIKDAMGSDHKPVITCLQLNGI
jgi:endonuclease/exonuclease/phosphatase (EEP) superfamily protein YafD